MNNFKNLLIYALNIIFSNKQQKRKEKMLKMKKNYRPEEDQQEQSVQNLNVD